ncbi:MAG: serine/threonine-protein kinase [Pyrinomonadaceae bacterium]
MESTGASNSGIGGEAPDLTANRIEIEQIIGRGGMGTVYRARHLSLDRLVAVKVINTEFAADADASQRFTYEARLMAKLRHPKAATIYDAGSLPDGRLFIVMEYVEGTTLSEVLAREGRLPYRRAVEIAVSICDVLGEAHSMGIIHRDLKPANIMLNSRGVFVLDFGIAKMLKSDTAESLRLSMTGKGALIGTPFYMSPEQCLGEPVDIRSDLYSLGALLFEMLAGRPPFDDEVISAIIIKHAMVNAPGLEEFNPELPPQLCGVVNHLLQKKPDDRPASASATQVLLEASVSNQEAKTAKMTAPPVIHNEPTREMNFAGLTQSNDPGTADQMRATNQSEAAQTRTEPVQDVKNNRWLVYTLGGLLAFSTLAFSVTALIWFFGWPGQREVAESNSNTWNKNANTWNKNGDPYGQSDPYGYGSNTTDHSNHGSATGDDFVDPGNSSGEDKNSPSAPLLTTEEADKVITHITNTTEHRADGMQIIKTPKDTALVCLHNMVDMGKTHTFVVERPNLESQWQITARMSLDVPGFRSPNWQFEPQDVNGDGFEEVIFSGASADGSERRVLVYEPRTRQNYWVLAKKTGESAWDLKFSPNAEKASASSFKKALETTLKDWKTGEKS